MDCFGLTLAFNQRSSAVLTQIWRFLVPTVDTTNLTETRQVTVTRYSLKFLNDYADRTAVLAEGGRGREFRTVILLKSQSFFFVNSWVCVHVKVSIRMLLVRFGKL